MSTAQEFVASGMRSLLKNDTPPTIKDIEKAYIESLLCSTRNKYRTAYLLGVTVKTLYNKLHDYGLSDKYIRYKDEV